MLNTSDYEPDIGYRARISYPGEGRWFIARMACMQKMQEQFSANSSPRYQNSVRFTIRNMLNTSDYEPGTGYRAQVSYPGDGGKFYNQDPVHYF